MQFVLHDFKIPKQNQAKKVREIYALTAQNIQCREQDFLPISPWDKLVSLISQELEHPSSQASVRQQKSRGLCQHPLLLSHTAPCQIHETQLPV